MYKRQGISEGLDAFRKPGVPILVVGVGLVLAAAIAVYVLWQKQPSVVNPQVKVPVYSDLQRGFAVATLIVVGLCTLGWVSWQGYQRWQDQWTFDPDKFGIAIAEFGEEPDMIKSKEGRRISGLLHSYLMSQLEDAGLTSKIDVRRVGMIKNEDAAYREGERRRASVVIWGWWAPIDKEKAIVPYFTVIKSEEAWGQVNPTDFSPPLRGDSFQLSQQMATKSAILARFIIGLVHLNEGNYDAAGNQFESALEQANQTKEDVNRKVIYLYIGRAYAAQGKLDVALLNYQRALDSDPNYAPARIGIGNIYYVQGLKGEHGKFDQAITEYQSALKVSSPQDNAYVLAHVGLGNAFYMKDRFSIAIDHYREAIAQRDYAKAYYSLGLAYEAVGDLGKARQAYLKCVELIESDKELSEVIRSLEDACKKALEGLPSTPLCVSPSAPPTPAPRPTVTVRPVPPTFTHTPSPPTPT